MSCCRRRPQLGMVSPCSVNAETEGTDSAFAKAWRGQVTHGEVMVKQKKKHVGKPWQPWLAVRTIINGGCSASKRKQEAVDMRMGEYNDLMGIWWRIGNRNIYIYGRIRGIKPTNVDRMGYDGIWRCESCNHLTNLTGLYPRTGLLHLAISHLLIEMHIQVGYGNKMQLLPVGKYRT